MNDPTIPEVVLSFIAATNSANDAAFVAIFTDDAYINDWGREFVSLFSRVAERNH